MGADIQQSQLKYLEQTRGPGSDDNDVGGDWHGWYLVSVVLICYLGMNCLKSSGKPATRASTPMSEEREIRLESSWKEHLASEFKKSYMAELRDFLLQRKKAGAVIYPPGAKIFNALDSTPFDKVRVVVLGQDPYHGPGQAHGLCFSVRLGVPTPPSLINIFREIADDLNIPTPDHGYLQHWANQGVLLLNAVLTVERGRAGAHQGKGWERFTDQVVRVLNAERDGLVFMLWGSYALKKGAVIDRDRHLVLTAPHPSPLSASRGFFGCQHFSRANRYLEERGLDPIDWSLPGAEEAEHI
jgi:uracil-DNA glycosylase